MIKRLPQHFSSFETDWFLLLWRGLFLLLLLPILMGGCLSPTAPQTSPPVIKLVENPWASSALNNAVAKILLEEQLNYQVETVPADGHEQWELLATGQTHFSLEIWTASRQQDIQTYIYEQNRVEHAGSLGVVGRTGWFIPAYVLEQYPKAATWQGLKQPHIAQLFSTPTSAERGVIYGGNPNWGHHEEVIIEKLGLPFEVTYTPDTEEELVALVREKYQNREPILFYFWTPHYLFADLNLMQVQLPPYEDDCYEASNPEGKACDYMPSTLFKIRWPGLPTYAPQASQFLSNFHYTNEDQITMLALIELENKSVEAAARFWLEQNEGTWQAWLP